MTNISKLKAEAEEAEAQEKADHMRNFEILKDEFEAQQKKKVANSAHIADDTWIKFEGTERPARLKPRQFVEVKTQGGMISNWYAGYMSWNNPTGIECNKIIAYRVIQPAADRVSES